MSHGPGPGSDLAAQTTSLDAAIAQVSTFRATLGAAQNRLEHALNNLSVTQENLTASEKQIPDTGWAPEDRNVAARVRPATAAYP